MYLIFFSTLPRSLWKSAIAEGVSVNNIVLIIINNRLPFTSYATGSFLGQFWRVKRLEFKDMPKVVVFLHAGKLP